MRPVAAAALPGSLREVEPLLGAPAGPGRVYAQLRYRRRDEERADDARTKIVAALDRIEAELGGRAYLVGDSFTVADLTAASLLYPLVRPPEGRTVITELAAAARRVWRPFATRPGRVGRADVRRSRQRRRRQRLGTDPIARAERRPSPSLGG